MEDGIELRQILAVLRRRAWIILGSALLAGVLAFGIVRSTPPTYSAAATVYVLPSQDVGASAYSSIVAGQALALTYSHMLTDRPTLKAVIDRLGLQDTPETLADRVRADPVKDTQLIQVSAADPSPTRAAQIANAAVDVFVANTKARQEERYRGYLAWLQAKVTAQQNQMDGTQSRVDDHQARSISAASEIAHLQARLVDYRNNFSSLQADYQTLQSTADQLRTTVRVVEAARASNGDGSVPLSATVTLLVDQGYATGRDDYSAALASERVAATYAQLLVGRPVLEAAIAQLKAGESADALAKRVGAVVIPSTQLIRLTVADDSAEKAAAMAGAIAGNFVDQVQAQLAKPHIDRLAVAQRQRDDAQKLIDETRTTIEALTAQKLTVDTELAQLQSRLAAERTDYQAVQHDFEQARLLAAQSADTVMVTQQATAPDEPANSGLMYILLAVVMAGGLALGIAFLIDYLNETIRTADGAADLLGLPNLGVVGRFACENKGLAIVSQPKSPAAEAFRAVAANIRLSAGRGSLRTLLITSAGPLEGKSIMAANLAAAMAGAGLRVVIVDADLRNPRQHQLFGLPRQGGIIRSLHEGSLAGNVQPTRIDGVRVLANDVVPGNPTSVVSSPDFPKLLARLAENADLVVIDTPPVLVAADTTIMAAMVDGVLFVVRADRTLEKSARDAVKILRQAEAKLVGLVLNAASQSQQGYYQYDRYGHGRQAARTAPKKSF